MTPCIYRSTAFSDWQTWYSSPRRIQVFQASNDPLPVGGECWSTSVASQSSMRSFVCLLFPGLLVTFMQLFDYAIFIILFLSSLTTTASFAAAFPLMPDPLPSSSISSGRSKVSIATKRLLRHRASKVPHPRSPRYTLQPRSHADYG